MALEEIWVSTGVRKPGNTMCVTDRLDMTLAVKVALHLNTTSQLSYMELWLIIFTEDFTEPW